MAAAAAKMAAAGGSIHWETSDFHFDPYNLTVAPVDKGGDDKSSCGAAPAVPVKRRPGRQKRTSVLCQVAGCDEELVDAKKYYRRYRICQSHCNMPSMMIEGRRQRFCQQCGRFHDIVEFEASKKSCKRKLKRHNERRRSSVGGAAKKGWQSDSEEEEDDALYQESSESEAKGAGGKAKRQSARRAARPTPAPMSSMGGKKAAPGSPIGLQPGASGDSSAASHDTSSPSAGQLARQLSDSSAPMPNGSVALPALLGAASPSAAFGFGGSVSQQTSCGDEAAAMEVHLSEGVFPQMAALRAASMPVPSAGTVGGAAAAPRASSVPAQQAPQAPVPGLGAGSDAELDAVLQSLLQDEDLCRLQLDPLEVFAPTHTLVKDEAQELPSGAVAPGPVPSQLAAAAAGLMWGSEQLVGAAAGAAAGAGAGFDGMSVPMDLLEDIPLIPLPEEMNTGAASGSTASGTVMAPPPSEHSGGSDIGGLPWQPGAAAPGAQPWGLPAPLLGGAAPCMVPQPQLAPAGVSAAMLAAAQGMMSSPGAVAAGSLPPLVGYGAGAGAGLPNHHPEAITRLSLKVFSCTPDRLMPAVRQELEGLLQVGQTLLEGYLRPGCTHLTLNALMSRKRVQEMQDRGLGAMVTELLGTCGSDSVLQQDMLVQFGDELAVIKRRRVVAVLSTAHSPALVPALAPLLPLAVAARADAPAACPLLLRGRHLAGDRDLLLARQQGANLAVEVQGTGCVQGGEFAKIRLLGLRPGFADVEVQRGMFLSPARALAVLPCAAAVAEVRQLERGSPGIEDLDSFLRDMGLVVQWLCREELAAENVSVPPYTPALLASVACKARQLVAAAVARGWAATVEMLLPAVTADGTPAAEAVAAMSGLCPSGATLLHVAVGTGCVPVVAALAAWGRAAEHAWQVDVQGGAAHGLTPLHLAALLPNGAQMRGALAAMSPAANKLWGVVQADDGTTPEALADALAAAAAARVAAAQAALEPSDSLASTCSSGTLTMADLAKASGSTAKAPSAAAPLGSDVAEGGLSTASSSAQEVQAGGKGGAGGKPLGEAGFCGASQRRSRGRAAMKQHLDDLHMTTLLSEVESGCEAPRPLSSPLEGVAALLRALRGAPAPSQ